MRSRPAAPLPSCDRSKCGSYKLRCFGGTFWLNSLIRKEIGRFLVVKAYQSAVIIGFETAQKSGLDCLVSSRCRF